MMDFDYSVITRQIKLTRDQQHNVLFNGYTSLYLVLGTMEGINEVWNTLPFSQRCAFTAGVAAALGVNPDEIPKTGMIFGFQSTQYESQGDYLIEVIDPRDDSALFVSWFKDLERDYVMKNPNDINGLFKFLVFLGEVFEEDQLIDVKADFTDRAP